MSISEPISSLSTLSPNFLIGINLIFEGSLLPNPFSGGMFICVFFSIGVSIKISSKPFNTHPSPIAINFGL